MQVWIRLFRVGVRAVTRRGDVGIDHVSTLDFRVGVGDIDVNLHMNNGRYLTVMDLGRIDILIRTGLWREMRARRTTGVVAVQRVRYRIALDAWERFRLVTRILGWNEEGIVFEHRVLRLRGGEEKLACAATVRFVFVPRTRGERRLNTTEMLETVGVTGPSQPLPDEVLAWLAAERREATTRASVW